MKKVLLLLCLMGVMALLCGCSAFISKPDTPPLTGTYYVEMDIAGHGVIVAELYADIAPVTVENFLNLVDRGFYDGLTFHRIIKGFVVQGGAGEGADAIYGEFAQNGFTNDLKHLRGVLSMARTIFPNSATSQFFIVHEASPHLDGAYAAFGRVISGMEVVDALCLTPVEDENGTVKPENQPVINSIRRIDKP